MVQVIITMAGFGRRFLDAGYTGPKYRLPAHGRSIFAWSILSLNSFIATGARFVFVTRRADEASGFVHSEAHSLGIAAVEVVELDSPTDGQATTALLAAPAVVDRSRPIVIYNIDTFVNPAALPAAAVRGDGWIPCFEGEGDAWSFVAADASGRITVVREKVRISPHATIGLYYFSSFDLFEETYVRHYSIADNTEKGERYVAPIYNTLIKSGRPVYLHTVPNDAVIPLGVPAEYEAFLARTEPAL